MAPVGGPGGGPPSVGFALSQLGLATSRAFAQLVEPLGVEPRHFAVLRAIRTFSDESQHAIAERLGIPASTMVGLVDGLEAKGLVERAQHRSDRRAHVLTLTRQGAGVLRRAEALGVQRERELCAGLSEAERTTLLALLGRVAANLGIAPGALPDKGRGR
ncbi:MAG TPA: MarR family transcriptional regulator [Acidimicrobiales bacterium]|nr:MarR family transcriptional regulator [Acidimicrobiales bacterium]